MSSPLARLGGDGTPAPDAEPAVVDVGGDEADEILDALGSQTARGLYRAVSTEPAPPSALARRLDTSVQNVHYHLSNLAAAGLVEVVGSRYSEKGNEMDVYGAAATPVVLAAGTDPTERSALQRLLADWAAGVATVGLVAVALQLLTDRLVGSGVGVFEPASPGGVAPSPLPALADAVAAPGLLFFVGGAAVLTLTLAREYRNRVTAPE